MQRVQVIDDPSKYKASDYFLKSVDRNGKTIYIVLVEIWYYSKRYREWIICERGDISDGATGAYDIDSFGWLFHDDLCRTGKFNSSLKCTNWQASMVVSDILDEEGRWFRKYSWRYATYWFGGGEARKNGMKKLTYHVSLN